MITALFVLAGLACGSLVTWLICRQQYRHKEKDANAYIRDLNKSIELLEKERRHLLDEKESLVRQLGRHISLNMNKDQDRSS